MRKTLIALAGVTALVGAAPANAYDTADAKRKFAAEMARAGLGSGAMVRDLDNGQDIYAMRPDVVRIPASVEKLYTTSATLLSFGPNATFDTVLKTTGPLLPDGTLQGDLVLVGAGDPFFGVTPAQKLVAALKSAGVRKISGRVIGDETFFDRRRSAKSAKYDFEIGGVLSGLAYDRGIFDGRAKTAAGAYAATRFAALLNGSGIPQGVRSRAGTTPPTAVEIARVRSLPVRELIRYVNVPSNNFAAEMLMKNLGARLGGAGSTAAGTAVTRDTLDDFGIRPKMLDGSGLSRSNRTTPRQVVRLLERMHNQDTAASFQASLAVPGKTGTVKGRMRGTAGTRCQVKTGTLRGVSALAGYCKALNGTTYGFAFLTNRLNLAKAHGIQDRMTTALAKIDEAAAPAPVEPLPSTPEVGGATPARR